MYSENLPRNLFGTGNFQSFPDNRLEKPGRKGCLTLLMVRGLGGLEAKTPGLASAASEVSPYLMKKGCGKAASPSAWSDPQGSWLVLPKTPEGRAAPR